MEKERSPVFKESGSQWKAPQKRQLQKETRPLWQSALKWGLGGVEPGSTPSGHTAELPAPVLPWLTQSLSQVITQRFRLCLNSSHTGVLTPGEEIMAFTKLNAW